MPRVCVRKECGAELLKKDGTADFRRLFCSKVCKAQDRLEKLQVFRAKTRGQKCPKCGRGSSGDTRFKAL